MVDPTDECMAPTSCELSGLLQVAQLHHELNLKDELLQFYTNAAEESEDESSSSPTSAFLFVNSYLSKKLIWSFSVYTTAGSKSAEQNVQCNVGHL